MKFTVLSYCALVAIVNSSKCPEPRKPHHTSCTIFYNCVNLPSDGYVWVPSKCTDGLVFQPYLRMCVLPGDTWTCDTLSTESTLITKGYEIPALIDLNQSSYLGYTEDPLKFSEPIDSSYTINETDFNSNNDFITPYPLIEVTESIDQETNTNKNPYNIRKPVTNNNKEHNYELHYINAQQGTTHSSENKESLYKQYTLLSQLISRLLVYKYSTSPNEHLLSSVFTSYSSTPAQAASTSYRVTSVKPIVYSSSGGDNILLNHLIQNYVQNNIPSSMELDSSSEEGELVHSNLNTTHSNENTTGTANTILQKLIDESSSLNNIVLIYDNLGKKQYMTIASYKSIAHQLKSEFVDVIPCTKNVRLDNKTDCSRYYICDPSTVSIIEYSCPLNTAFNRYARVCDIQSTKTCSNIEAKKTEDIMLTKNSRKHIIDSKNSEEAMCSQIGKSEDPTSNTHYYVCYSSTGMSADMKSIRMACPKNLVFCKIKKVCTSRQLCKNIIN